MLAKNSVTVVMRIYTMYFYLKSTFLEDRFVARSVANINVGHHGHNLRYLRHHRHCA